MRFVWSIRRWDIITSSLWVLIEIIDFLTNLHYVFFSFFFVGPKSPKKILKDFFHDAPVPKSGPYFDMSTLPNNVTGLVGHTTYLHCRVRNLGNQTVSNVYCFIYFNIFSPFINFIPAHELKMNVNYRRKKKMNFEKLHKKGSFYSRLRPNWTSALNSLNHNFS